MEIRTVKIELPLLKNKAKRTKPKSQLRLALEGLTHGHGLLISYPTVQSRISDATRIAMMISVVNRSKHHDKKLGYRSRDWSDGSSWITVAFCE